jgi:C4-dicarboxylate transporter, DctM subunit
MSNVTIGLIGIGVLMLLLLARMWNSLAMALVGFFGLVALQSFSRALVAAGQAPYIMIGNYTLAVIPMFVLMGVVVSEAGIGADVYYAANRWFGSMRGGLAIATTWACAAFGAITGMTISAIIIMAKVALPEMRNFKYADSLSAGTIAAASTLGIMIPPSIGFVIYGLITETSIGSLFMAGILPGISQAVFYMLAIMISCKFNPKLGPPGPKTTMKEKVMSLKYTWAVLLLFLLVMGGIYAGIFTATEAGAIGAFGAIIIAIAIRKFGMKVFLNSFRETGVTTAMILALLMGVSLFQKFIALSEIPFVLGDWVTGMGLPNFAVIVLMVILYILLGCFLPEIPVLMLTTPIFFPVILAMGYDPIWWGVIMVRVIEIGGIAPPVGMNCFVLSGLTGISVMTIYRGVMPFVIADVAHMALLLTVPAVSLFLPNLMMR